MSTFVKQSTLNHIIEKADQTYCEFIEELIQDTKDGINSNIISKEFIEEFSKIIIDKKLKTFTPLKFYWLNMIEQLIEVSQMHEDLERVSKDDFLALEEIEDEIETFWNEQGYSESFDQLLDECEVTEASLQHIAILENQIVSFFYIHFSQKAKSNDELPYLYCISEELGDSQDKLYLNEGAFLVNIDENSSYPYVAFRRKSNYDSLFTIEEKSKKVDLKVLKNEYIIDFEDKNIFCTGENNNFAEVKSYFSDLKIISPSTYDFIKKVNSNFVLCNIDSELNGPLGTSYIPDGEIQHFDLTQMLILQSTAHFLNLLSEAAPIFHSIPDEAYYNAWRDEDTNMQKFYHDIVASFFGQSFLLELFESDKDSSITIRILKNDLRLKSSYATIETGFENGVISKEGFDFIRSCYENLLLVDDLIGEIFNLLDEKEQSLIKSYQNDLLN